MIVLANCLQRGRGDFAVFVDMISVVMKTAPVILIGGVLALCSCSPNSTLSEQLVTGASDPFVGYVWTASLTGNPTWTFSNGNNLTISSSMESYTYAVVSDTLLVSASTSDTNTGTYVFSVVASNHIHLFGPLDFDLTH